MPKLIEGIYFKELFCKNDNCRHHVGYEQVKKGALAFICKNCGKTSIYKINYGKMQENIDMIIGVMEEEKLKGGE